MGARPVAILDSLRFGASTTAHAVPRARRGRRHRHYGNCIGVPTVGGDVYFDAGYDGNILVNAFTLGIAPRDRSSAPRRAASATRSSTSARAPAATASTARACSPRPRSTRRAGEAPAVQVGDPVHREAAARGVPRR
jgi:phosphoribosylformylglycinamidine synthase